MFISFCFLINCPCASGDVIGQGEAVAFFDKRVRRGHIKVLLVADSKEIAENICLSLRVRWPYVTVVTAASGRKGVELVQTEQPDVVLLDLDLPDMDGFEVLSEVRLFSEVPIVILSAREDVMDKVRALEMGADVWITKPFNPLDLLAKVNVLFRRCGILKFQQGEAPSFVSNKLTMDFANREVCVSGKPVKLTPTEYNLLCHLVRNKGTTVTHHRLLDSIWGPEYISDIGFLKKYIYRLRSKIENGHDNSQMIVTERGIGYKFVKPASSPE